MIIDLEKPTNFRKAARLTLLQWLVIEAMFLFPQTVILCGGAGFGGKSHLLRAAAIYFHLWLLKHGYHGVPTLFCSSSYEALRDRHFQAFDEEYGELGEVKLNDKHFGRCFRFYDRRMGAICFRNLADKGERRGSQFAAGFLDETTEILRAVFGEFMYRIRYPGIPHRPVVTASNPDGIGFQWVKGLWRPHIATNLERFPDGEVKGICFPELRERPYDELIDPTRILDPRHYIYIPFLPDDNPVFDETDFNLRVAHLPPRIQKARRYGLWDAPEGSRWPMMDADKHIFRIEEQFPKGIPAHWPRILGIDYGHRAPYCCLWHAIDYDENVWTYRCDYQADMTADVQAERICNLTKRLEKIEAIYLDPHMWDRLPGYEGPSEKSTHSMYEEVFRKMRPDFPTMQRGYNRSRVHGFTTFDKLLNHENQWSNWRIEQSCGALWTELTGAIYPRGDHPSAQKSEDLDKSCPDHAIAAGVYSLHTHLFAATMENIGDLPEQSVNAEGMAILREESLFEESIKQLKQDLLRQGIRMDR